MKSIELRAFWNAGPGDPWADHERVIGCFETMHVGVCVGGEEVPACGAIVADIFKQSYRLRVRWQGPSCFAENICITICECNVF